MNDAHFSVCAHKQPPKALMYEKISWKHLLGIDAKYDRTFGNCRRYRDRKFVTTHSVRVALVEREVERKTLQIHCDAPLETSQMCVSQCRMLSMRCFQLASFVDRAPSISNGTRYRNPSSWLGNDGHLRKTYWITSNTQAFHVHYATCSIHYC